MLKKWHPNEFQIVETSLAKKTPKKGATNWSLNSKDKCKNESLVIWDTKIGTCSERRIQNIIDGIRSSLIVLSSMSL